MCKFKHLYLFAITALAAVTSAFAQIPELQVYRGGSIIQSFHISGIDSLKVGYSLNAPVAVNAQLKNRSIVVTWPSVDGAMSYEVYRSGNNTDYIQLTRNHKGTTYTDSAPLNGTNYYKVKAIGEEAESGLSVASAPVSYNDDNSLETGLYMGIIGFNENLIDKGDMSLLAPNTKSSFISFVNSLTTKKNTVLYYAVDNALNKLTSTTFPSDLRHISIVTFTDGLDQGSLPMINYDPYVSKNEYRAYLDSRIKTTQFQGLSLSAYTIGLRGGDVTNYEEFQNNLVSLSSSRDNATEVTNMTGVNSCFQEIANQLTNITEMQTMSIRFPMLDDGQMYRFTFDNVTSASQSECYIEGTMNVRNNTLNNVRYVGLTCSSGTSIQGTRYGINISFDFVDIKDANGKNLSLNYVKEYYMDGSFWQVNSEFDKGDDVEVKVERSSAAIMLVLDCSSSLQSGGDKFTEMKTHVMSFIETLASAMDNANNPGGGGSADAHEYVDLGLPSGTLWATCNIGAEKPSDYGDYFAWGETIGYNGGKTTYNWSSYKLCKGSNSTMKKYCTSSSYGTVDNKTELEPADDAATVNWGSNWQMPSFDQLKELINSSYTTTTWTTMNGVYGRKITSKSNLKSIFLPAAGYRDDTSLSSAGSYGYYWSRSLSTSNSTYGCYLFFYSSNISTGNYYRYYGRSVRPVRVQK